MSFQTVCFVVFVTTGFAAAQDNFMFPDGFLLGAATASYQIEGGWDADGKAEFNTSVHNGYYIYRQVWHQILYIRSSEVIYMFCSDLKTVITYYSYFNIKLLVF